MVRGSSRSLRASTKAGYLQQHSGTELHMCMIKQQDWADVKQAMPGDCQSIWRGLGLQPVHWFKTETVAILKYQKSTTD